MLLEAEMLVANQSLLPELSNATSRYWQASSHPQNIEEIKNSAIETFRDKPALLAGFAGLLTLEALELSPLNETILVDVARDHFVATNREDIFGAAARVGAITMAVETTIGLGFALYLHKAKDTVRIVHNRYLKKAEDNEDESNNREHGLPVLEEMLPKNNLFHKTKEEVNKVTKPAAGAGKIVGLALLTGAGGATIIDNVADEDPTLKKSVKYAVLSAGSIAMYDMAIASGIMIGTKSNIPILKEVCEVFIDVVKNPRVVFLALTGALGLSRLKEYRKTYKKLVQEGRIE